MMSVFIIQILKIIFLEKKIQKDRMKLLNIYIVNFGDIMKQQMFFGKSIKKKQVNKNQIV